MPLGLCLSLIDFEADLKKGCALFFVFFSDKVFDCFF